MDRLPTISVSCSRPLLLFVSALVLVGFSLWTYRRTLPPVSGGQRRVLLMLRIAALLLMDLVLFGTTLRIERIRNVLPRIALIVDDSRSMRTEDRGTGRDGTVRRILRSPEIGALRSRADLRLVPLSGFGEERPWADQDSLEFDAEFTDLAGILGRLDGSDTEWDAALLISDGAHNRGEDPIRRSSSLSYPVFCATVGSSRPPSDVVLSDIVTSDIAFVGHVVPVDIALRGPGFGGRRVRVTLRTEGDVLAETSAILEEGGAQTPVRLSFQPELQGLQRLVAEVTGLEGETTYENNAGEAVIRVRQGRFRVLLAAGSPHPDLAFLRRILAGDENVDLTVRTQRRGGYYEGDFPGDDDLRDTDLFVLMDLPTASTPEEIWTRLLRHLETGQKPFLLFVGKGIDGERLRRMGERLPAAIPGRAGEGYVMPRLSPEGRFHPVLRVHEDPAGNRAAWERLPPLFATGADADAGPGSRVLVWGEPADGSGSGRVPLLVARHQGDAKALLFLGHGLYRWDLLMWGVGESNEVLSTFLENAVRWLATREDQTPVRLSLNRVLYEPGEDILLTAQVYDETYRPLSGALVSLRLQGASGTTVHALSDAGGGRYRASFRLLEGGRHAVRIDASLRGQPLGSAEAEFWVSSFTPELLDTRADPALMAGISEVTGGRCGPPDSLHSIVGAMEFPVRSERVSREIVLHRRAGLLAAVLLLLSAEWFLRRRRGMV